MNARTLLSASYAMAQKTLSNLQARQRTNNSLWSIITEIEEYWTWTELKELFSANTAGDPKTILQPFVDFLAARWDRIKDNDELVYTSTYSRLLTKICESVATELSSYQLFLNNNSQPYHRYELLMPTLDTQNENLRMDFNELDTSIEVLAATAQIQLNELMNQDHASLSADQFNAILEQNTELTKTKKIQLRDFILDNSYKSPKATVKTPKPILIYDCLQDSKEDGILKHTSSIRVTGEIIPLTTQSATRVIYHSKQAFKLHNAILERLASKSSSPTAGAAIQRLAKTLENASMSGQLGGTDDDAAVSVYPAILEFYNYLQTLSRRDYNKVMECRTLYNIQQTFAYNWYILLISHINDSAIVLSEKQYRRIRSCIGPERKFTLIERCVQQAGRFFENILKNNPDLYQIVPKNVNKSQYAHVEKKYNELVKKMASKLKDAINQNTLERYADDEIIKLPREIKRYLVSESRGDDLKVLCRNMIKNAADFSRLIMELEPANYNELINECLGSEFLQRIIPSLTVFIDVLPTIKSNDVIVLVLEALGKEFLQNIITTKDDLNKLKEVLSRVNYLRLRKELIPQVTDDAHTNLQFFKPAKRRLNLPNTTADSDGQHKFVRTESPVNESQTDVPMVVESARYGA